MAQTSMPPKIFTKIETFLSANNAKSDYHFLQTKSKKLAGDPP